MNTDNKIGLMSVADLTGKRFIIPDYQRGYRWEEQQVTDLLKDMKAFMEGSSSGYYCLQPLAVKQVTPDLVSLRCSVEDALSVTDNLVVERLSTVLSDAVSWEVIDGQQRLTTIYILIRLLDKSGKEPYSISYKTRDKSDVFLKDIQSRTQPEAENNIDFLHMYQAFHAAEQWLSKKDPDDSEKLKERLLDVINNRVKFIWYESVNEEPINVFTRLNIGRISLTNAELIKATLLNRSNYPDEVGQDFLSLQMEISKKWDEIEYSLQNEDFWLFLNDNSYKKPTRIDFLFELIHNQDIYGLKQALTTEQYNEVVGHDKYSVFRYFASATEFFEQEKTISDRLKDMWAYVVSLYNTFLEWYNDKEYYHYIGFILWDAEESAKNKFDILKTLYTNWNGGDKQQFKLSLIRRIREDIIKTNKADLNRLDFNKDKRTIKRILLLHNICDVLDTQKVQKDKYELNVFYKFPFHLFKKETWNVEHIDSATTNELTKEKERKSWIRAALYAISQIDNTDAIRARLNTLLQKTNDDEFNSVHQDVERLFPNTDKLVTPEANDADQDNERMHIWNLTLLDEGTNKAYKNSIFSVKRSFIIFKEKGQHCSLDDTGQVVVDSQPAIAFVPSCTKQVFMKYYNPKPNDLLSWGRPDAEAYLGDIMDKLNEYLTD